MVQVDETVTVREALAGHKTGPDSEGVFVVEPDWRANAESGHGTIVRAISEGRPSQGEEDSLPCAKRFVRFLRTTRGETWWDDPVEVKQVQRQDPGRRTDRPWVDCEASDRRDPKVNLQMQVSEA